MNLLRKTCLFVAALIIIVSCIVGCKDGGGYVSIGPVVNIYVHAYPDLYDKHGSPPVDITMHVEAYKGIWQQCKILWGEGGEGTALTSPNPTHTYTKRGQYVVWISQYLNDGSIVCASTVIQIGVREDKYCDEYKGNITVLDRELNMQFMNYEQYAELEGHLVDVPAIASFISAERLNVLDESKEFGWMRVELPEDTAIEEAVSDWPSRYPELIHIVEPIEVLDYSNILIL